MCPGAVSPSGLKFAPGTRGQTLGCPLTLESKTLESGAFRARELLSAYPAQKAWVEEYESRELSPERDACTVLLNLLLSLVAVSRDDLVFQRLVFLVLHPQRVPFIIH